MQGKWQTGAQFQWICKKLHCGSLISQTQSFPATGDETAGSEDSWELHLEIPQLLIKNSSSVYYVLLGPPDVGERRAITKLIQTHVLFDNAVR